MQGLEMRTTLTIDDDVLSAARERAEQEHKTVGEVISALARQALRPPAQFSHTRSGIPLLPIRPDGKPVTLELVNRLRDELP
jgi:hypothetical protein